MNEETFYKQLLTTCKKTQKILKKTPEILEVSTKTYERESLKDSFWEELYVKHTFNNSGENSNTNAVSEYESDFMYQILDNDDFFLNKKKLKESLSNILSEFDNLLTHSDCPKITNTNGKVFISSNSIIIIPVTKPDLTFFKYNKVTKNDKKHTRNSIPRY